MRIAKLLLPPIAVFAAIFWAGLGASRLLGESEAGFSCFFATPLLAIVAGIATVAWLGHRV